MRKGNELPVYVILLIALVVLHFVGPDYLNFVDWSGIFGRIVDAPIVFTLAVIIPSAEGATVAGKMFPSVVAITKDGDLLVGEPARRQPLSSPCGGAGS